MSKWSSVFLYVLPETAQSQALLKEDLRDCFIARSLGAEYSSKEGRFIIPDSVSEKDRLTLMRNFSGLSAKERYDSEMSKNFVLSSYQLRQKIVEAALQEVKSVSGRSEVSLLSSELPSSERLYLFSVKSRHSEFSTERLMECLKKHNCSFAIDYSKGDFYGLRYVSRFSDIPKDVWKFSLDVAEKEWRDFSEKESKTNTLLRDVAKTMQKAGDSLPFSLRRPRLDLEGQFLLSKNIPDSRSFSESLKSGVSSFVPDNSRVDSPRDISRKNNHSRA